MHVTRRNVLQHVQCRTCKLFFTPNNIIVINRFKKRHEIVIVQNLAIRYVTMFLYKICIKKRNFKVIKMLVFAYFTMSLINIYRAPNGQRD